jgi:hypothetical protein
MSHHTTGLDVLSQTGFSQMLGRIGRDGRAKLICTFSKIQPVHPPDEIDQGDIPEAKDESPDRE